MNIDNVLVLGGHHPRSIGFAVTSVLARSGIDVFNPPISDTNVLVDEDVRQAIQASACEAVVYAVGVNELEWTHSIHREQFDRVMHANVWGFLNVIKILQEQGRAYSVVAIGSDAATRPMRTTALYCASKAALAMAARVASRELAPEGWRINVVSAGKVEDTPMTEYVDERVLQLRGWTDSFAEAYEMTSSPIGRKLSKLEVAQVVAQVLTSDAAAWTGDVITVNGGRAA